LKKTIGRYSKYLRPLTIIFDICVLNALFYFFSKVNDVSLLDSLVFTLIWVVCAYITTFYEVFRFTKIIQIADKSLKQFALFFVFSFAYMGFFSKNISNIEFIKYLISCFVIILFVKYAIFNALKVFRKYYNGNLRRVIVIGSDSYSMQLTDFFQKEKDYGYFLSERFENDEDVERIIEFCENKKIDEIYYSLANFKKKDLKKYIAFADNNFKTLKFIPTKAELVSISNQVHYYGYIAVIPSRKFPMQKVLSRLVKRIFDLLISSLVIVFVLSWMVPLIGLLIKLESKGPVFFNQIRNGLYYKEFNCYKFRSMYVNQQAHTLQATKNDKRITKVGKFLRKSSLDEMPQFFNVFIGNMSVCGPRPHMISLTNQYEKTVNKFKLRHYIKPGITGMAQTHGCRGEIESERDIVNRVKYDIFYLENWSLLLDIKIIYLTVKNAVLGDKKAY